MTIFGDRPRRRLKDITLTEISLVDVPASPGADIVLMKRAASPRDSLPGASRGPSGHPDLDIVELASLRMRRGDAMSRAYWREALDALANVMVDIGQASSDPLLAAMQTETGRQLLKRIQGAP